MTDILLFLILLAILLPIHCREKNAGWYGKIYVTVKKRGVRKAFRWLIKAVRVVISLAKGILRRNRDTVRRAVVKLRTS